MTDSFVQEVDESLAQDRFSKWWRQWRVAIIGFCLTIVIGVAVLQGWNALKMQAADQAANSYAKGTKLLTEGKFKEADAIFVRLSQSAPSGFRSLARQQHAGALLAQGEKDNAIKALIAASQVEKGYWKDLALFKAANLQADKKTRPELENLLRPILAGDGTLKANARVLLASKSLADGDFARARSEFDVLRLALDAPPGVRQMASIGLAVIDSKEAEAGKIAKAEPANTAKPGPSAAPGTPANSTVKAPKP